MSKTKVADVLKEAADPDRPGRAMSIHHLKDGVADDIPLVETEFGSHSRSRRPKPSIEVNPEHRKP